MALDEAVFEWTIATGLAAARLYTWNEPTRTRGYFQTAERDKSGRLPVRRYTGGGLVEHGGDLTFLLTFPAGSAPAAATAAGRYRWLHETLARTLTELPFPVALEAPETAAQTGPCFANPVPWDLLDPTTGAKIGGGAQRRSRGAVIHQGSLRLPPALRDPAAAWTTSFLTQLSQEVLPLEARVRERVLARAVLLEEERYASAAWNEWGSAG